MREWQFHHAKRLTLAAPSYQVVCFRKPIFGRAKGLPFDCNKPQVLISIFSRYSGQLMLANQSLVGISSQLFAIDGFLALAAAKHLLAATVCFSGFGPQSQQSSRHFYLSAAFFFKTNLSDSTKQSCKCRPRPKLCGVSPPPLGVCPPQSPLQILR